jgi:hypothetical protein
MDLVLCHHRGASCIIAIAYHEIDSLGIELHARNGDQIRVLVAFLGHGSKLDSIKESLEDIPRDKFGWFLGSPGELTDRIQDIISPGSVVNAHCKALDKVTASPKKRCKKITCPKVQRSRRYTERPSRRASP